MIECSLYRNDNMPLYHLWQAIKSHLSPTVLETAHSAINGEIQVVEVAGTRRIMVGGYVQSGGFVDQLWQRSLERVKKQANNFKPKQAAIFGFAGGSAARCLRSLWPEICITAVDIDPVIVDLGKKYFETDKIKHLTIHIASVFDWIKSCSMEFDIIVIDLFKGGAIPQAAASLNFLSDLHRITSQSGIIVVNYFPHESNKKDMKMFDNNVRQIFSKVTTFELLAEKMYLLEK